MLVVILIILITLALFFMFTNKNKDNFIFFKPLNEKGTEIKLINNKFINNSLNITIQNIAPFKKVIIIDNFLKNTKYHLEYIKKNMSKKEFQTGNSYPGVKIKEGKNFSNEMEAFLSFIAMIHYNHKTHNYTPNPHSPGYSIVTFPNHKLTHGNIFPHVVCRYSKDNVKKLSGIACVVYFCNKTKEYNGTGFYELKYPIYKDEFNTEEKYQEAREIMDKYVNNPKYCIDKEEKIFKKIYEVDAKMNRIVLYPTDHLNQGIINSDYYNDENNIRKDRYTYTDFRCFDYVKVDKNDIKEPEIIS